MTYVDGFLLVIPKGKVKDYKKMAEDGKRMWMKYGALEYYECIGDDLSPQMGGPKTMSFPKLVKLKKNETVWFSFIIFKSKKHRDLVNKKVMSDPNLGKEWKDKPMPMDMKRTSIGGFKVIVEGKK